ncbi:MAG: ribosomal L7Ae/L30e/S12e/Gadd45 family protein [Oscillospiraceae bacterium]|nr:ribosomal L7Ae/L30e/S12e/Gadd45 family protein [Oscillospiraceae bacterium]
MLDELKTADRVVGLKQLSKVLKEDRAAKVFVAEDADPRVTQPVIALAREKQAALEMVPTMKQLGHACGIEVGAAAAAVLKK